QGSGSGAVLGCLLGFGDVLRVAQRCPAGDFIAVPVQGNGGGVGDPGGADAPRCGNRSEPLGPVLASVERAVQLPSRCSLDELLAFVERGLHVVRDRLGRCGDESGDPARPGTAALATACGGVVDSLGELRGPVGLVLTGCDSWGERGEDRGDVVPGGLVPSERACEVLV